MTGVLSGQHFPMKLAGGLSPMFRSTLEETPPNVPSQHCLVSGGPFQSEFVHALEDMKGCALILIWEVVTIWQTSWTRGS